MKTKTINEERVCPKCGQTINQVNAGFNRSGTQRCLCKDCNYKYTLNPKTHKYPEEVRQMALRIYYSGVSGRGVGKVLKMSKANIYNWIKKTEHIVDKSKNQL